MLFRSVSQSRYQEVYRSEGRGGGANELLAAEVAVNLANECETNLRPSSEFALPSDRVAGGGPGSAGPCGHIWSLGLCCCCWRNGCCISGGGSPESLKENAGTGHLGLCERCRAVCVWFLLL